MLEEAALNVAALARSIDSRTTGDRRVLEALQRCLRDLNATAAQEARARRSGSPVRLHAL